MAIILDIVGAPKILIDQPSPKTGIVNPNEVSKFATGDFQSDLAWLTYHDQKTLDASDTNADLRITIGAITALAIILNLAAYLR